MPKVFGIAKATLLLVKQLNKYGYSLIKDYRVFIKYSRCMLFVFLTYLQYFILKLWEHL